MSDVDKFTNVFKEAKEKGEVLGYRYVANTENKDRLFFVELAHKSKITLAIMFSFVSYPTGLEARAITLKINTGFVSEHIVINCHTSNGTTAGRWNKEVTNFLSVVTELNNEIANGGIDNIDKVKELCSERLRNLVVRKRFKL